MKQIEELKMHLDLREFYLSECNYSDKQLQLQYMRICLVISLDSEIGDYTIELKPKIKNESETINFTNNTFFKTLSVNKKVIITNELMIDTTTRSYKNLMERIQNKYNIPNFEEKFTEEIQNLIDGFFQNYFNQELANLGITYPQTYKG